MSFIRARKINWNKFFTAMVACDPYGLTYMPVELIAAPEVSADDSTQPQA
jgi:hypothetical protein